MNTPLTSPSSLKSVFTTQDTRACLKERSSRKDVDVCAQNFTRKQQRRDALFRWVEQHVELTGAPDSFDDQKHHLGGVLASSLKWHHERDSTSLVNVVLGAQRSCFISRSRRSSPTHRSPVSATPPEISPPVPQQEQESLNQLEEKVKAIALARKRMIESYKKVYSKLLKQLGNMVLCRGYEYAVASLRCLPLWTLDAESEGNRVPKIE